MIINQELSPFNFFSFIVDFLIFMMNLFKFLPNFKTTNFYIKLLVIIATN